LLIGVTLMAHHYISRRTLVGSMAAALAMPAAPASAARTTIKGTVSYRERLSLSFGTDLSVRLLDVTLGNDRAEIIAEAQVLGGGRNPMHYWITFDRSRFAPTKHYALDARVTAGDMTLLRTPYPSSFYGHGADRTNLIVEAPPGAFEPPYGRWPAEDFDGKGVSDHVRSVLIIEASERMVGKTGCNVINGHASIDGGKLHFGGMSMTAKVCVGDFASQESKFSSAIKQTSNFLRLPAEKKLLLMDLRWKPLMRLAEM
jgi:putative lipoprotein